MTPDPRINAWLIDELARVRRAPTSAHRAFVVGVSGPQGGGKSTLAAGLVDLLEAQGLRAVTVSIDDFYLTHAEQRALAAAHPGDRCLEHRGYPGTHDVALGDRVLDALANERVGAVRVPVYDKSAHRGRGDRAPVAREVQAPLDVVIVEGWMLGFRPLSDADCPLALRAANDCLSAYERWHRRLDAFVLLVAAGGEAERASTIVRWRVDAERARRERGEAALSDAEVQDYIERFIPAYEAWLPELVRAPPCATWLRATIGADRWVREVTSSASGSSANGR